MAKKPFYETAAFKTEQAKWYAKIAEGENGFVDLEKGETDGIIRPEIIKSESVQHDSGIDYYEFCQKILREFRFRKELHRLIFSLHAEGWSVRNIAAELKNRNTGIMAPSGINLVIQRTKEAYLKGAK